MNILLAPDSFKGSLTALEAATVMGRALAQSVPNASIRTLPLSDGGEGALEVWEAMGAGKKVAVQTEDAQGRPLTAHYFIFSDGNAWVALSQASGLVLLSPELRGPKKPSSYGTGVLIMDAISQGAKKITVGLGGSATNDGGSGLLQALGFLLEDSMGNPVKACGENLHRITRLQAPKNLPKNLKFEVACDVNNPLLGSQGATHIYGPQKGASPSDLLLLERGMEQWAKVLAGFAGKPIAETPGTGAAGGAAAGLMAGLQADLRPGFDLIAEAIQLDEALDWADVVITGEGMLDAQSLSGKATVSLCQRARARGCTTWVFAGRVEGELDSFCSVGVDHAVQIALPGVSVEESMARATEFLNDAVLRAMIK